MSIANMSKLQVVSRRFIKAFVSGFCTGVAVISIGGVSQWSDLTLALNGLVVSGVMGGINGVIMALEKWASYKDVV